ncbi:MAG TPA: glycosyltransferase family 1 protein [Candidatus Limnocylindria bacterium]|nr:glycosyltransferase family 1 protein [Candidatus Limnocylindria bacterium]
MKIAIDLRSLSSGTISGVENYCLNLLENLLAMDRQNEYVLFYNGFVKKDLPNFHFVNSRVKLTRIPNKILNLGFKLGVIKLEKLIGNFDCLFMPNLNQFSISSSAKLAITVHDLSPVVTPEFYDVKRRIWHKFLNYKKAFNRANVLFAVSEYTKNDLIKIFNIKPEKIKVIYPGTASLSNSMELDSERLRAARNEYDLPGKFILFLNTIEPRKNLSGLIKAFEQADTDAWLVIAGRLGWKYSKDFALIKHSKKSAKIKYIGYVEEKYKPALIKLASALVYPSFYEGFGFQPLEAMGVGTPVMASQLTSLPEVVGQAGLLVNPYDVNNMVVGLEQILKNRELISNLKSQGHEQAKKFSWHKAAEQVLASFKTL